VLKKSTSTIETRRLLMVKHLYFQNVTIQQLTYIVNHIHKTAYTQCIRSPLRAPVSGGMGGALLVRRRSPVRSARPVDRSTSQLQNDVDSHHLPRCITSPDISGHLIYFRDVGGSEGGAQSPIGPRRRSQSSPPATAPDDRSTS